MNGSRTQNDDAIASADELRASRLADWAESDDFEIADTAIAVSPGDAAADALLEGAFGTDELSRLRGRPSLSGPVGAGPSPKRQVRLPRELDALLVERAEQEHRRPSELMREAIAEYLSKAS